MAPFFRRSSNLTCFFCQCGINPLPTNPRSFRCPHCSCWNRFDANGEIISDEPAMHDEAMNAKSFAKRASPSKDRLPSFYGRGQFCHTCQTNQMLLVNLLSNYLPNPQHPDYAKRLEMLPQYRESLHIRYPPVCANCLPAVEEEIKQKDHMARTKALGGWLKESKGKERQRQVSSTSKEREKLEVHLTAWRIRGLLWVSTLLMVLMGHSAGRWSFPHFVGRLLPVLPVLTLFSLLWTAWDPTYHSFRKARIQGRDLRVQGKNHYIILQMTAWLSRLLTSVLLALPQYSSSWDYLNIAHFPASSKSRIYCSISLIFEISVVVASFTVLHLRQPPPIRLIDTSSHQLSFPSRATSEVPHTDSARPSPVPTRPSTSEPDLLASLSLSSKPVVQPNNPIFGLPSLLSSAQPSASPIKVDEDEDEDAMDWTPTHSSSSRPPKAKKILDDDDDGSWLRPQRFFPPERPTGLESLFASTKLADDVDQRSRTAAENVSTTLGRWASQWWWVGAISLIIVPLGGIAIR
ncbi:hypothetical protein BV22DRAFT_1081109, partial [Leucogyrophana mollusca]